MKDKNSLSHTSYRCKYHIVIVPKYWRLVIYNKLGWDIVGILTLVINRKLGVVNNKMKITNSGVDKFTNFGEKNYA